MKRLFDILVSAITLAALLPGLILIALAVRLSDSGPALFKQRRVGLHGSEFQLLKFRSMVVDAALRGSYMTAEADPRVTRIGRFIRRTSLDELPQFVNVLAGDMSLVGPRPDVPAQRALYTDAEWVLRHSVRPGITGLAQATVRSEATPDERKRLDLEYVIERTFIMDLRIILWTFKQVLGKGGN